MALAASSGTYKLEVRAAEEEPVAKRYVVKSEELRAATSQDRSRAAAARIHLEAEELFAQDTVTARRQAIPRYEEALALWHAAGDQQGEADTFHDLGFAYHELGEEHKALDSYSRALALRRAGPDRAREGMTLSSLGTVQSTLGEKLKALDSLEQALALRQLVGNNRG